MNLQETADKLLADFRERTSKGEIAKKTTYSGAPSYGWSKEEHEAMRLISQADLPDINVSYSINYGVTDWVISPKITIK